MKTVVKATLLVLSVLPVAALATEIEFQVPVRALDLPAGASHVVVTCGSFNGKVFQKSAQTEAALNGKDAREYNGIVKVNVAWPGSTEPTGRYRCTLSIKSIVLLPPVRVGGSTVSEGRALPRIAEVAAIEGNFSELQSQASTGKVLSKKP